MSIEQMEHKDANNHRNLGRELGIFMFSADVGSGLPLWLPRGAVLRDTLERFLRQAQLERGYLPVVTPHIGKLGLYKTSGHWYKYRDSIYPPMLEEDGEAGKQDAWTQQTRDGCGSPGAILPQKGDDVSDDAYILKPMNCPHHIQIFKHEMRSYRDLPMRLAEFGTVYRFEQSGELNGLLRTRDFTVDDSHIFVTPEQAEDEFMQVIDLALSVFQALKLKDFAVRVGVRDPASSKYIGSEEAWEKAQAVIMNVVRKLDLPHTLEAGEAGFYGPKLDFLLQDALGRQWQLGTAQVDYNLPERFDLGFIGEDGQRHRPVMIHRANFGSIERVVAILLEHFGGALPVWLAPVQVALIPIADKHIAYAQKVSRRLQAAGLRSEVDSRSERMNAKIRAAQMQKIPYMLVVGAKEEAEQEVSVRLRTNENLGNVTLDLFIGRVLDVVETKSEGL